MARLSGNWGLPVWPKPKKLLSGALRSFMIWAQKARLHPAAVRRGHGLVRQRFTDLMNDCTKIPEKWQEMEYDLEMALDTAGDKVIIGDDKEKEFVWMVDGPDLQRYLLQAVEADDGWRRRDDLTQAAAISWLWCRAAAALPEWLRGPSQTPHGNKKTKLPYIFPLVKHSMRVELTSVARRTTPA